MNRSAIKSIFCVALWNIAAILLFLAIAEGCLRYFGKVPAHVVRAQYYGNLLGDFQPNMRCIDARIERYPYEFTTNAQGLRALYEISETKQNGTIRILCLGDSFTMGWGVNDRETFPELLQQMLSKKYPGVKFEVVNAGNIFSNILDEMDYFEKKGRKLNPDLVLLQFYPNDIYNEMSRPYVNRIFYRLESGGQYGPVRSRAKDLVEQTAIFNSLSKTAAKLGLFAKTSPSAGRYASHQSDESEAFLTGLLVHDLENVDAASDWNRLLDEDNLNVNAALWNNYAKALKAFSHTLRSLNTPLLFIAIPPQLLIGKNINAPGCFFAPICHEESIPFIDFTKVFRKYAAGDWEKFYLPGDGHTTPFGNALIAAIISEHIEVRQEDANHPRISVTADDTSPKQPGIARCTLRHLDNELKVQKHGDAITNFSAKLTNIEIPNDEQASNGFSFFSSIGDSGRIDLSFSFNAKVRGLDMLYTNNILNDATPYNGCKVSYSLDGKTFHEVRNDVGTANSGMTMRRQILDIILPQPADKLLLRFDFSNKSGLIFPNKYTGGTDEYFGAKFYGE